MHIGVGIKYGFCLSLLGLVAIASTAFYAHSEVNAMLRDSAKQRLLTATTVLGRRFTVALSEIAKDVALMSRLEEVEELANGSGDEEELRQRLADIFSATLELHPQYLQIRLIGAHAHGKEMVRVDRTEDGVARVKTAQLQEKGHFPYVYRTLAQRPGSFYLSEINLNRERGFGFGLGKPTLRLASPVHTGEGKVFGLVIVNVELNDLFALLRADLPAEMDLYLTNADGDYLIHPDATRTFGFDRGRRMKVQDDFPASADVLDSDHGSTVLEGAEQVSAFVDVPFGEIAPQRRVLLGLVIPNYLALQGLDSFARRLIYIVAGFSVLAVVASLTLSKLLVRPLDRVVAAVNRFSTGGTLGKLPTARNDEVGVLSRSISSMARQIGAQIETLKLNETNLNRILEAAPSGMIIAGREDHSVLFMNTSARARFGQGAAKGEFHPIDHGLAPQAAAKLYQELEHTGKVEFAEHRVRLGSGQEFWALLSIVSIEYQGQPAILISVVDITERKNAEVELARYRNELEELVEQRTAALTVAQRDSLRNERLAAIGQLTGTVSHELRNPLGTILASFTLLRSLIEEKDPRVARVLDRIDRNISRCDNIIEELLDYTRMREVVPEPTELDPWLRQLVEEQELPKALSLEWQLASSVRIPIDRDRMAQAVINVVQNACQAMSDAGPLLKGSRLTLRTRALAHRIEIEIQDNGPGIEPDDQERVFEPLFSKRPFGIGLGLPHVRQVMDAHQGGVEIHSQPGAGTRVTLWLPRDEE